ncbi:MAG: vanadium nitrogenase [Lachnospiraceae bacterium]|nr:vanadium nitrogenase [Lachnospiraceae bacterium]
MNFLGFSGFLGGLLYYACLFIVLVVVMVAGIFVGKKLRDRKEAKKSKETEKETTIVQ